MAKYWETEYLDLIYHIKNHGNEKTDRTGVGTKSIFGTDMNIDLKFGFPALTTRTLFFKSAISELLWFLEGSTDERRLAEIHYGKPREELIGKTTIWTANADNQGKKLGYENSDLVKELGPVYGKQWTDSNGVNQIVNLIDGIKNDPNSRRHLISAWNVEKLSHMALPPCHYSFQFYVNDGKLSCKFTMRSTDVVLGLPTNIASYALLTHMIAHVCNLEPDMLIYSGGDVHIYNNQFEGINEQLQREPFNPPTLKINRKVDNIFDFKVSDFELVGYEHHPTIKFPFAV